MRSRARAGCRLLSGLVLATLPFAPAAAQVSGPRISLVEAVTVAPAARPAMRRALATGQAARLRALKARGVLTGYQLLFNRYADAGAWDAMEILTFSDAAALARWNRLERTAPAGLAPALTRGVLSITSAPADEVRAGGEAKSNPSEPVLVIPYDALVPVPEYLKYFDGYTAPQMRGWIADGALAGYELHIARFYAGRPWTALLVLRYRDDASLVRRDEVTAKVRAALAHNPTWKAISDNKQAMRKEKQLAVADELAAEAPP